MHKTLNNLFLSSKLVTEADKVKTNQCESEKQVKFYKWNTIKVISKVKFNIALRVCILMYQALSNTMTLQCCEELSPI